MEGKGIYREGPAAQSQQCRLIVSGALLNIYPEGEKKDLLIWKISSMWIKQINHSEILITYGKPEQFLSCSGAIADKLIAINSGGEKPAIQRSTVKRSVAWILLIVLALIISTCLFIWFYLVPWAAEKAANLVPVETEIKIGDQLSNMYDNEIVAGDSAGIYLQQFASVLKLDSVYPIRVNVIRSNDINAFAVPGGRIFVYSGIIKKMHSYEQLVALLGHEVTHVQNRHSLKSICRSAVSGIVLSSILGDVGGISSAILSEADKFKELDYSRDLETEADDNGLRIMIENKVDPQGMLDLLELLKKESGETPALMKYLSTHPDTEDRIRNIQGKAELRTRFGKDEQLQKLFNQLRNSVLRDK